MKTESMIERVARAMCVSDEMDPDSPGIGDAPAYWRHYVGMARAAIEAMRGATPTMLIKGGIAIYEAKPLAETAVDEAAACWDAAIEDALSEDEGVPNESPGVFA